MSEIIFCSFSQELMPVKHTPGAVCRDLFIREDIEIVPGKVTIAGTGFKSAFPMGWHSKIYARSSLSSKLGLTLANAVAVMDQDYRGEYFVQLLNFGSQNIKLTAGTRVAQMEVLPYFVSDGVFGSVGAPSIKQIVDQEVYDKFEEIYSTKRGDGKFGSTGFD